MYPVAANFHNLSIQDAPKTRIRIYFIGDSVDCTDDADVVANGTLLVGKAGDTDSNGRIASTGVVFNEMFNPEKNVKLGSCVSSQISMTLMNFDGALNGYAFGRCKVYIDVYDAANSTWLACPMGVYILEQPVKTKQRLISVTGYDQMQKLDASAATWWNGIDWLTTPVSMYDLLTGLATAAGFSVSSNSATAMVNEATTYSFAPVDGGNMTYREILSKIAEASGTIARFDRDGALDMRLFGFARPDGIHAFTVNTDIVGNQCLSVDFAEYGIETYGQLTYKYGTQSTVANSSSTFVPNPKNKYVINGNEFINQDNPGIVLSSLSNILGHLFDIGAVTNPIAYYPAQAKLIMDWSIEAGDQIVIKRKNTSYTVPIFQQTLKWRGGYVVSDLLSDGDPINPNTEALSAGNEQEQQKTITLAGNTTATPVHMKPGQHFYMVIAGKPSGTKSAKELIIAQCDDDGTVSYGLAIGGNGFTCIVDQVNEPYILAVINSTTYDATATIFYF